MKSYLKPSISGVQSDVLLAKLQGTGGLGIVCTQGSTFCDMDLNISCINSTGIEQSTYVITFFGDADADYSNCHILWGPNELDSCTIEPIDPCGTGELYAIECVVAGEFCPTFMPQNVSIVCGDEHATCRGI